ncbi:hypothetical protein AB0M28_10750 [Streptomyces sp. NPDC051940]|uniref:hypothetical protein n=1 Tax=Streptomyces sp. NPDC051940 TaxID=3155675 RepID=UPI0034417955
MTISLPLIVVAGVLAYFGFRLYKPPGWLVAVLILGGLLLAYSDAGPPIHDGVQTSVNDLND